MTRSRLFQVITLIFTLCLSFGLMGCEEKASETPKAEDKAKPGDKPAEAKPGDKPAEAKPGDKPAEAKPGDKPAEAKPADKPTEAKPGDKPAEAKPAEGATPEQIKAADTAAARLLVAMKGTADIITANMDDAAKTLSEVKAYLEANDAELKVAVAAARKNHGLMTEAQQDEYQTRQTSKPEYQAWATAMEKFEEKHPDDIGDLEELLDEIQSAGAGEDTIVEASK